ncbi:MAG: glycosyltransferase [Bacteroidales bacterium]|nr:glycosyltransferase [Bacteroidales bacterium]
MLVGYDANNVMRYGGDLGEWCRWLVGRLAERHVSDFRALLFSTRIRAAYRTLYTSYANVSTYVPFGTAKLVPSAWMRYRLNPILKGEKVKIFHGLNEELPYGIGRDVKTIVTCYGLGSHRKTSLVDSLFWHQRMRYSFRASDVVVAASEAVREELLAAGVAEQKIVVIDMGEAPYEVTDRVVEQYYSLYERLSAIC